MSCFWKSILKNLDINDFKKLKIYHKPKCKDFIVFLKNNIIKITNVKWNGESLSEQFINDAMQHVKNFDVKQINKGYECSSCDPVLILISELFTINVSHTFNNHTIINYTNENAMKTIYLFDNGKHIR